MLLSVLWMLFECLALSGVCCGFVALWERLQPECWDLS